MAEDSIDAKLDRVVNVKTGCICRYGGKSVGGLIYIDPCCRVHFAETRLPKCPPVPPITKAELDAWKPKKRVSYPKLSIAKAK